MNIISKTNSKPLLASRIQCIRDQIEKIRNRILTLEQSFYNCCGYENPSPIKDTICGEIQCGILIAGTQKGYQEIPIVLGYKSGVINLEYNAFEKPERFVLEYNGLNVIDTGYRGNQSYDSELVNLGLESTRGIGSGSIIYNKTSESPIHAILKVYGQFAESAWTVKISCPQETVNWSNNETVNWSNNEIITW